MNKENIFFLAGSETFLLKEKIKEWKKAAEKKYGQFNTLTIFFEAAWLKSNNIINKKSKEIISEISTPSFFGEKRIIFLENFPPFEKKINPEQSKYLLRIIKNLALVPLENVIVISCQNPDKRTKIFKELNNIAKVEFFEKLEEKSLLSWICHRFKEKGCTLKTNIAQEIINFCGHDLWKINQEIEKLTLFKANKEILLEDIKKICTPSFEIVDFAFANAIQSGKIKEILINFKKTIDSGVEVQSSIFRIIAPIIRQIYKIIWALKYKKTARDVNIHPFVFSRCKNIASQYSEDKIKIFIEKLILIDQKIKTGKIEISSNDQRMLMLQLEKFLIDFNNQKIIYPD